MDKISERRTILNVAHIMIAIVNIKLIIIANNIGIVMPDFLLILGVII